MNHLSSVAASSAAPGMNRAMLAVTDLRKSYGTSPVVDGVSFHIAEGEFYTLLGPSGCGKTTTLRCVAGLERHSGGSIAVDGAAVSVGEGGVFVPPQRRGIGMVFQSYGIWPHMSVFENVAFPLRVARRRTPAAELKRRVAEALETVELGPYGERDATALSGGQQQRLALARAIVSRPKLLLLDEPLSNLDAKLRDSMRAQVRSLQRELGITTLYVTHDQTEAMTMSTKVAVMKGGRIVQEAPPRELFRRPATGFVASFLGCPNIFPARLIDRSADGQVLVELPFGRARVAADPSARGDLTSYAIRPEDVRVRAGELTEPGQFPAVVASSVFAGATTETELRIGDTLVRASHSNALALREGDQVALEFAPAAGVLMADD